MTPSSPSTDTSYAKPFFTTSLPLQRMVIQRRTLICILPDNELFRQLAYPHTSAKSVSIKILTRTTWREYLSISGRKRLPLFANQLAYFCDSHTSHIA